MMVKRRELEKVARQQHKREYDSDEETDAESGTWEHRLRTAEMDITRGEHDRCHSSCVDNSTYSL